MSEILNPKNILKAAVGIIVVFGIAEVLGFSGILTNPVSFIKQKLSIGA